MAAAASAPIVVVEQYAASIESDRLSRAISDRFVVFDLETTGLDPESNEIIEVGAIRVNRRSGERQFFRALVRARHAIPKQITDLTGITQEMVEEGGQSAQAALAAFLGFIGDLPLVTFAADFDMAFLRNALERSDLPRRIGNPVCCALKMARCAWPFLGSYRLADLARDGAIFTHEAHRAVGDCERALLVFLAATRELNAVHD